jgi:hypothetical protein
MTKLGDLTVLAGKIQVGGKIPAGGKIPVGGKIHKPIKLFGNE